VDVSADLEAPCSAADLYIWVSDLSRYPAWLDIVPRAEPTEPMEGDPGPAWSVDLRGRLGRLARSKRLRMVRTVVRQSDGGTQPLGKAAVAADAPLVAVFERREGDGRAHAPWVLRAEVVSAGNGSRLTMSMHYGGALWGPVLERLLGDEIGQSRGRLLACVSGAGAGEHR
jgi:hypothetical protein